VPTVCGRRAVVAQSLRSPISVRNSRFSTNRDKLNRQTPEVEHLVTRRKQRIALSSNRQKIQFCKSKNLAPTEASSANPSAFLPSLLAAASLPAVLSEGLPRALFAKSSVRSSAFLTGSAPQTEFSVTHSKQKTATFLPGSRFARQASLTRREIQKPARRGGLAQVNVPARRGGRNRYVIHLSCVHSASHDRAFQRISTRFCTISRNRRNSLKTNAPQISTRHQNCTSACPEPLRKSLTSKEVSYIDSNHAVHVAQACPEERRVFRAFCVPTSLSGRPEAVRHSSFRLFAQNANVSSTQEAVLASTEDAMAGKGLEGQVALVTGGAKRVGRSIALGLAAEGADVVVNYLGSKAEAEELAQEIRAMGRRAVAIGGDVSKRQDVEKLFMAAENEFGRLDILVNNAGIFQAVKFEDLTEEEWDHMMNANLKSQFLCAQEAAPIMKRRGRGRIINLVSLGAWPSYTHYCVSKAGCIMLTQCLARALGPEILVNAVAPGTIQFPGEAPDEDYIRRVPLHRTGKGEDIAGAVVYLASADFVTGQVIVVDGGRAVV
jgi:NAD(P)-dependent dehydrogenase (short-subunit alcohol dehydrogenase family)